MKWNKKNNIAAGFIFFALLMSSTAVPAPSLTISQDPSGASSADVIVALSNDTPTMAYPPVSALQFDVIYDQSQLVVNGNPQLGSAAASYQLSSSTLSGGVIRLVLSPPLNDNHYSLEEGPLLKLSFSSVSGAGNSPTTLTLSGVVFSDETASMIAPGTLGSGTVTPPNVNQPPATPAAPAGPNSGNTGEVLTFITSTIDPEGDPIQYLIDWGDGTTSTSSSLLASGQTETFTHSWASAGNFSVTVTATDSNGNASGVSQPLVVSIALDTDGDGIPDSYEIANGLDPLVADAAGDADGDGLSNLEEYQIGTNPQSPDTDGDGIPDKYERDNGMDPLVDDSLGDVDGDGISNLQEYLNSVQNLLTNGGFEQGDKTGWSGSGAVVSNNSQSGTYAYRLTGNTGWPSLYQEFPVTAGNLYTIRGWLKVNNITTGKYRFQLRWYGANGSETGSRTVFGNVTAPTGYVEKVAQDVVAPSGAVKARLYLQSAKADGQAYYDDVSVVDTTGGGVNVPPVANDASLSTAMDTPVNGTLSASDADGDPLTYSLVSTGSLGVAVITDASTGAFTYTPNAGAAGTDSFTFTASDGVATSNTGTVTVTIYTNTSKSVYEYAWTKIFGGISGNDGASSIAVDSNGNIYIGGSFNGEVDFDPTTGVDLHTSSSVSGQYGAFDAFVTRINADGSYGWTRTFGAGGYLNESINSIAVDNAGDVYLVGGFSGSVDFDPGPGVDTQSSAGAMDIYIMKLYPDGSYGWAKTFGDIWNDYGYSIAVDGQGKLYIGGAFRGTVDFDPGPGVATYSSVGFDDAFVLKLNTDGTYDWVRIFGGNNAQYARSISLDDSSNVYLTGWYSDTIEFSPGNGFGSVTAQGGTDIFVAKLFSDGGYGWLKSIGGIDIEQSNDIAVNNSGDIFITGYFSDTVDFDPGAGIDSYTAQFTDLFVTKLYVDGSYGWTRVLGDDGSGSGPFRFLSGKSVAADSRGDIFLTGRYTNTVDFDFTLGSDPKTSVGLYDAFLLHITSDGDYGWAGAFGSSSSEYSNAIAIDSNDNIYVAGSFSGTVDFDIGGGIDNQTFIGYQDVFLMKMNAFLDSDGDGVKDSVDAFPDDPTQW